MPSSNYASLGELPDYLKKKKPNKKSFLWLVKRKKTCYHVRTSD